jgi:hypothetical protein
MSYLDLDGVWERNGRNPAVGAVLLVLGLGSVYFAAQIGLQGILIIVDAVIGRPATSARLDAVYQPAILAILALTQYGLFLFALLAIVGRWHTRDLASYLRLRRVPWAGVAIAAVGVLGLLPAVELLARFLYDLVPELRDLAGRTAFLIRASTPAELVLVLGVLALTPAVCEELVFRAYLQRTLERRIPAPASVIVAGVFFALFHQQVLTLPSLVIVGVYLSFIYYAFASPYPVMVAHLLYNGTQIVLANLGSDIPGVWTEAGFELPAVLAGLGLSFLSVLLSTRRRK